MGSIRRAAGILLYRETGDRTEVLLVERNPALRFFGGFHAFPGGVLEAEEDGPAEDGLAEDENFRRCAVRELFEETGVLLSPSAGGFDRDQIRKDLIAGELDRWFAGVDPTSAPLRRVMSITTPPLNPRRYRAEFYLAELPSGEAVDIWPGELVSGQFLQPETALQHWRRGEMLIAPPVILMLELLCEYGVEGLPDAAHQEGLALEAGKLHPVRFMPGIFTAALETETLPPATTTNCLLVGADRFVVIDPAPTLTSEQERLFQRVDEFIGRGAVPLAILLTHHHRDHVGAVGAVASRYQLPVWAHRETLSRIDLEGCETGELNDGDRVELGRAPDGSAGWTLRAVYTPGHAPGHLAFFESRYSALIAGDLLSALSTMVIDPVDGNMTDYLASLSRIRDLGVGMVHPAHGPAIRDGQAAIEEVIDHRLARESRIAATLTSRARTLGELVESVYSDTDVRLWPLARRSLEAHLIRLQESGRARRDGSDSWRAG